MSKGKKGRIGDIGDIRKDLEGAQTPSLKGEDYETYKKLQNEIRAKPNPERLLVLLDKRLAKAGKKGAAAEMYAFASEQGFLIESEPRQEIEEVVTGAVEAARKGLEKVEKAGATPTEVAEEHAAARELVQGTAAAAARVRTPDSRKTKPAPVESSPSSEKAKTELGRFFDTMDELKGQLVGPFNMADRNDPDIIGRIDAFKEKFEILWDEERRYFARIGAKWIIKRPLNDLFSQVDALRAEGEDLAKRILTPAPTVTAAVESPAVAMPAPAPAPETVAEISTAVETDVPASPTADVRHETNVEDRRIAHEEPSSAESKGVVTSLMEEPKAELEFLSGQIRNLQSKEILALRSNPTSYKEYEKSTKRKIEQLQIEVEQGIKDLMALPQAERSREAAIIAEKKLKLLNENFSVAEQFLDDKEKFPTLVREESAEEVSSAEKREAYVVKIDALRSRRKDIVRLERTRWQRIKSRLGSKSVPPPQKIFDEVILANPLLKPGESVSSLSPEDHSIRQAKFLEALQGKGFKPADAQALYEAAVAKAEYQESLVALGNSMMDSERDQIRQAMERIIGLPFNQWPDDKKEDLEKRLDIFRASNVVDRVVIQEQQALVKASAESLPPTKKSKFKSTIDWYLRQNKATKMAISVALGLTITGLAAPIGIGAGLGVAGVKGYLATRAIGIAVGMPVMYGVGKGHDLVVKKLKILEKAEQKKLEKIELLRKNFSSENISGLQAALGEIMEERAKTDRTVLKSKMALTAAAGFFTARAASQGYLEFAGLADGKGVAPGVEKQELAAESGVAAPETANNGSAMLVRVKPGDTLWNILRQKLEEGDASFGNLSKEEQNGVIAKLVQKASQPETMKAVGIKSDVDWIYAGQDLNLSPLLEHPGAPGVSEHFSENTAATPAIEQPIPLGPTLEERMKEVLSSQDDDASKGTVHEATLDSRRGFYEVNGPRASVDSMARLWEMKHPGENPPASLVRQWAEMSADGILLKDTEVFNDEAQFRMQHEIEKIYGSTGLKSSDWGYWKKFGANEIIQMPDSSIAGPTAGDLREYLRWLKAHPSVEPPGTMGGRPETAEHFVARAEAEILLNELGADRQGAAPRPKRIGWSYENGQWTLEGQPVARDHGQELPRNKPGTYYENGQWVSEGQPIPRYHNQGFPGYRQGWYYENGRWVNDDYGYGRKFPRARKFRGGF